MRRVALRAGLWFGFGALTIAVAIAALFVLTDPLMRYALAIFLGAAGIFNILHAIHLTKRPRTPHSPRLPR